MDLNIDPKKQAILDMIDALKGVVLDGVKPHETPNEDPSHEASETTGLEDAEKATGMELGQDVASGGLAKRPVGEINMDAEPPMEGGVSAGDGEVSPFASDKERIMRNLYKGGQAKGMLAGVGGKKASKGKFGKV